ncbi:MAG TPA: hypothetical protein ENH94_10305 [Phycisphaerales bacterium]|nr:hypothetical protein [Phycisphaerales bacterium]
MKKQQNTETPQNTTKTSKTSPFLDKNVISANKIMKNKANFNSIKLTVTSCDTVIYNALSPKTQNGTKPNKANPNPIQTQFKTNISLNKYLISCCIKRNLMYNYNISRIFKDRSISN